MRHSCRFMLLHLDLANDRYNCVGCNAQIIVERDALLAAVPSEKFARLAGGGRLRREDTLVYRAGLLNKTGPVEVTLRDKLNNFAHLLTKVGNSEKYSANDSFSISWFQVFRFGRPAPITSSFFWMAWPL